jgi:hypothetical protein
MKSPCDSACLDSILAIKACCRSLFTEETAMRNRYNWGPTNANGATGSDRFPVVAGAALIAAYVVIHLAVAGAIFVLTPLGTALASRGDAPVMHAGAAAVCPVAVPGSTREMRHVD